MPFDYIPPILQKNSSKIVLLVMDGLGGLPMESGGPTELEFANTPHMGPTSSGRIARTNDPDPSRYHPGIRTCASCTFRL